VPRAYRARNTNLIAVSTAILLMSLGENLWRKFVPKYLEALGASVAIIGLFGTTEDFLDGIYQYPGGWLGDRLGRRRALMLFVAIAVVGYAVYRLAPTWPWIFVGLAFVMAWSSMASPTLFRSSGTLFPRRRAMGFTVRAILRRVPSSSRRRSARSSPLMGSPAASASLLVTIVLAALILRRPRVHRDPRIPDPDSTRIAGVWKALPAPPRRLLLSDVFIACEAWSCFLVLYATNIAGIGAPQFGLLIAIQTLTAMIAYIPAAQFADTFGRKPFVVATFVFFALFPIAVVLSHGFAALSVCHRRPARAGRTGAQAMIVDMVRPTLRARSIGLYYLIRSVAISPAAFVGGLLWSITPALPFVAAGAIGLVGTVVFAVTVHEREAS
jgi:MFS family permease